MKSSPPKVYFTAAELTEEFLIECCDSGFTFGADLSDIRSINILHPEEIIRSNLTIALNGWPTAEPLNNGLIKLESCFGWKDGEDSLIATRVWIQDEENEQI